MNLVTTVTYQYKVNGFLTPPLTPHRGLRQGDPLSPYLFILEAEVLSQMINHAQNQEDVHGIQLAGSSPILTRLFFADDALIFGRAEEEEIYQLVHILNKYCEASGQTINLMKSGLICGRHLNPRKRDRLARILQMQVWQDPGKYLGLPGDWGRSRSGVLSWIKEKIYKKLEGWKESLLNQAGKEVLIKAVIQAIPTYVMSIVRFPKNFCRKICSEIARFWWRGNRRDRGIHWKAWNKITVSKKGGGLGFKEFHIMNSAHLAKQAWRAYKNPNALWGPGLEQCVLPKQ